MLLRFNAASSPHSLRPRFSNEGFTEWLREGQALAGIWWLRACSALLMGLYEA